MRKEADRKEIQKQAKERADKRIEDLIKEIDIEKNISIKKLAYTKTYHQNSFALTQEYLQKEFLVNQDAEKRKLDLQLRGGKISKTYYNQMLNIMLLDRQTFERNQNTILLDEYDKQLKLLEQSEEAQIKTIKESYEKTIARILFVNGKARSERRDNASKFKILCDRFSEVARKRNRTNKSYFNKLDN